MIRTTQNNLPRFLQHWSSRACALALTSLLLAGCLETRSTGSMLDDQNIEYRVINAIYSDAEIGSESEIKVEVYENVVLLMGQTDTEARRKRAEDLASQVNQVERVVNEVKVQEQLGFGGKVNNSWLTAKVNTALITGNPIPGFDGTRIKAISSNGTVYLMGNVTRTEGDDVTEVVRNVGGVEKVVKVFNYLD